MEQMEADRQQMEVDVQQGVDEEEYLSDELRAELIEWISRTHAMVDAHTVISDITTVLKAHPEKPSGLTTANQLGDLFNDQLGDVSVGVT